jgi:4-hydroxy-tetrahydrodipicolinate synthase
MTLPRIQGIFTPNVVPLTARGDIDEQELARYVDWLIGKGVHGLYTNGSAGEFLRFSLEERRRITKIVSDVCRGRVPVLAGATEANVREVLESCELYAQYGARGVALLPPVYYKLSDDGVFAYFAEIAQRSPIDVTVYNIPLFATPISVANVKRLATEFPRVVGIKDSSGDVAHLARMIAAVRPVRPDFVFFSGWEAALVPQLVLGADGGTLSTSGVLPELTRRMYDLFHAGRLKDAVHLQLRLLEFFDVMLFAADFPEGLRAAVELRGFKVGPSRQPMTEKQKADRAGKLRDSLACVMSDFGVTDSVPNACPPRTSGWAGEKVDLKDDTVLEVTAAVMKRLREQGLMQ